MSIYLIKKSSFFNWFSLRNVILVKTGSEGEVMVEIYSKALKESIKTNRVIGHIKGEKDGPTAIYISGIHGNEPSGIFALRKVLDSLDASKVSGNIYALAGNLKALSIGERYIKHDLNRAWKNDNLSNNSEIEADEDHKELHELHQKTQEIIAENSGPFVFIDLHTTSSQTIPFLTINNHIKTIQFCKRFSMPKVLGIDEFVSGAFFSHMNSLDYVALGFEAGQHDDIHSIRHHESFIYLSLVQAKMLSNINPYVDPNKTLDQTSVSLNGFYDILECFSVEENKSFQMKPGFINFQNLEAGQSLARYDGIEIISKLKGKIFLPLYQEKGTEGFFIIRKISSFKLWVKLLRARIFRQSSF